MKNKNNALYKGMVLVMVFLVVGSSGILFVGAKSIQNSERFGFVEMEGFPLEDCSFDDAFNIDDLCMQSTWVDFTPSPPSPRRDHSLCFDSNRNVAILFGGIADQYYNPELFEWDGTGWNYRSIFGVNGNAGHATAYDSVYKVMVMFGGSHTFDVVWEYDGESGNWTGYSTETQVDSRDPLAHATVNGCAMTYDEANEITVMFGGEAAYFGTLPNITWGYDAGVHDWIMLADADEGAPSPRINHAMTYDSQRGVAVLFGGYDANGANGETWEWNGTEWMQYFPKHSPSPRTEHTLAYDYERGVVVLFGGYDANGANGETWVWNGYDWKLMSEAGPCPRYRHAMAYDSQREVTVLFGGWNDGFIAETWEWDGSSWKQCTEDWPSWPSVRINHDLAYDSKREKLIFFSGTNNVLGPRDTWEWDSETLTWTDCADYPLGSPTIAAMVYDVKNSNTVIFGGQEGFTQYTSRTALWDGNSWTIVSPDNKPSRRGGHAMEYDGTNELVVLFGGVTGKPIFNEILNDETWVWNGNDWEQKYPENNPSARKNHDMAYDRIQEELVLFGGVDENGKNDETWIWDGNNWEQKHPMNSPSARSGHTMSYYFDGNRGAVMLFGGKDENGALNDMWMWNGDNWRELDIEGPIPTPRNCHAMVFDEKQKSIMLYGGQSQGKFTRELWKFSTEISEVPCLKIGEINSGLGVSAVIENIGEAEATNVEWEIIIDGGVIVFPRATTGSFSALAPSESEEISMSMLGIGLGIFTEMPTLTVYAECAEGTSTDKAVRAKLLGPLVTIQE